MKNITELFKPKSINELQEQELYDARRQLLEYEAAVEYHTAMRDMLKARIERLENK